MGKVKARGNLLYRQQLSNLVQHIVAEIKEENKVIVNELNQEQDLVLNIVDKIEKYTNKETFISSKISSKIDKNDLTVQIYVALFPNLSEEERAFVEKTILFIINHKLIKTKKNFFLKWGVKLLKSINNLL